MFMMVNTKQSKRITKNNLFEATNGVYDEIDTRQGAA
jgi:hypothetical protein